MVGTRSAVFAPCTDLGLIILDEEQEHTYKSESSPRYHARDVAKFRCVQSGALLLLASATPSIESYHAAVTGRYTLHTLFSRYGSACLPQVEVLDMRAEETEEEGGVVSRRMKEEIEGMPSPSRTGDFAAQPTRVSYGCFLHAMRICVYLSLLQRIVDLSPGQRADDVPLLRVFPGAGFALSGMRIR